MAPTSSTIALIVLTVTATVLLATVIALSYTTKGKAGCKGSTFCGSRPPTCDFNKIQRDAPRPNPTPTVSTGYDWVAANYALNLFGEGARAYFVNQTPSPFPHTRTLALLSGVDALNPKTMQQRRLHNIAWVVKADGVKGAPDQIYIVWRGTQSNPEWMIDAEVPLVQWHPDYPGVQVHGGYDHAIKEVRDNLYALLTKHITKPDNTVVFVTGLSLGGGLSTVATADLITRSGLNLKDVRMYAFSTPRVGNKAFVEMMKDLNKPGHALVDMYTLINAQDIFPKLPPDALGYEPMPALTFSANWGDVGNNHLMAIQFAHLDRVTQKCPMPVTPPDVPV